MEKAGEEREVEEKVEAGRVEVGKGEEKEVEGKVEVGRVAVAREEEGAVMEEEMGAGEERVGEERVGAESRGQVAWVGGCSQTTIHSFNVLLQEKTTHMPCRWGLIA
jgi:hypothetical protein